MISTNVSLDKKVYAFELDDVLFRKADYDLQVYYLFAQFLAFNLGLPIASELVTFMKAVYERDGHESVFVKVKEKYDLDPVYQENFERLYVNAQLPLKLELLENAEYLMIKLFNQNKHVALLTKGNPAKQLNKVKHIEWGALTPNRNSLKIYFIDELKFRSLDPITYLAEDYNVDKTDVYIVELT